ncbi:MAG TPA: HAMP domain-containing sensor histidine kinase [Ohtaekwangia sp.]
MTKLLRKNFIYYVVGIISLLLLTDIYFTHHNNATIRRNRELQREAERIKLYVEQIGKSTIHGIDIGIRGYAIIRNEQFFSPVDSAFLRKDSILKNIEFRLIKQQYPQLEEFHALKDSLDNYYEYSRQLKTLLDNNKDEEFKTLFTSDRGLGLWLQYLQCQKNIASFEDRINQEATEQYEAALRGNYILQIILFAVCFPTLLYTAYFTKKTVSLSDQLHHTETEKNKILVEQNLQLEQFAFIAAHNLRAPLARILGLAHVLEISNDPKESDIIIRKIVASTRDLDTVIGDLNTILDIRKHTSNLKEINLKETLVRVSNTLEREMEETRTKMFIDIHAETITAVSPYVESILYNLLSNAIKYRHPDRAPEIRITTSVSDEYICLAVSDNGLGIDLNQHKNNLFNLYKRFHLHTEGKGMGLYLIKTQMLALGGKVEVESQPGVGTNFQLYFKK